MLLLFYYDLKIENKFAIQLHDAENPRNVIYTCIYQTQLERLVASLRVQRFCQELNWKIVEFIDSTEFNFMDNQPEFDNVFCNRLQGLL